MKTCNSLLLAALVGMFLLGCDGDNSSKGSGGSCGAFSACGGDLTGTWAVDGVCFDGDVVSYLTADAGLPAECGGLIQDYDFTVSGPVDYTNGVETANLTMSGTMMAHYTQACITAQAGQSVSVSQALCDAFGSSMADDASIESATCSLVASACDCTVVQTPEVINDTDTYTVSGSAITYSGGDRAEYCVSGTTLTMRKPNAMGTIAGQFTAHR